ncbi:major capsid protein [Puerhibacterium puerhi]|uniref:major capsid protein n=1 Tax=Puerhibacterium puerhi TaxID=2692623 RepID=UPI00135AD6EB|nr:major capsid protein [Puerhibacterium puerhi]
MPLNTDYRSAVELTAAARAAVAAVSNALPLSAYLPNRENPSLNFEFEAGAKSLVDVAEFRAFDTEAPYGRTGGGIRKSGKLPPISRKLPVSELAELQLSGQTEAIGARLDRYAEDLGRGVAFRLELARAEALRTGKLVLSENGLTASIDFGRDPSLTVVPSVPWTAANATPVDDVIGWIQRVAAISTAPTAALLTLDVMETLSKNEQVIGQALGRTSNLPGRVSYDDVRGVFAQYGLTQFTVVDQAYSGFDLGRPVFPAGTFVLLPSPGSSVAGGSLGATDLGIPAESLQPSYGIPEGERAGIFAGAFSREDPQGLDVLVSGIALPIVERANATLSAAVTVSGS